MKISIAIPTYNRPAFFIEALESCINQSLKPYEILVGDDSTDDNTERLVTSYIALSNSTGIKLLYQHNRPGLGQNANVDNLIKRTTGDKFLLLHDDDTLLPNALASMSACFKKRPGINLVIGKQFITSEDGSILKEKTENEMRLYFKTKEYEGEALGSLDSAIMQQIPMNGFLVDTYYVKKIGYPSKSTVGNACDYAFGINLALAGARFFFLNEYVSTYRLSATSINRSSKDDWGYFSFRILESLQYPEKKETNYKMIRLTNIAPTALRQAVIFNRRKEVFRIMFNEAYRSHFFSLGTVKSLLMFVRGLIKPY